MRDQFTLHKKSIKLCKTKKYKSGARGDAKQPPKFVLPKALDKDVFTKEVTRLEAEVKKRKDMEAKKKKDFTIGDIMNNQNN